MIRLLLAFALVAAGFSLVVVALWPLLVTVGLGFGAFRFMAHRAGWRRPDTRRSVLRDVVVLELGALLGLGAGSALRRHRATR